MFGSNLWSSHFLSFTKKEVVFLIIKGWCSAQLGFSGSEVKLHFSGMSIATLNSYDATERGAVRRPHANTEAICTRQKTKCYPVTPSKHRLSCWGQSFCIVITCIEHATSQAHTKSLAKDRAGWSPSLEQHGSVFCLRAEKSPSSEHLAPSVLSTVSVYSSRERRLSQCHPRDTIIF